MYDTQEFKTIINNPSFNSVWGDLKGNELKTAPRGIDRNHLEIDLIRKKQYIFSIPYSNKEVCEEDFIDKVEDVLKKVRPFVDYMSEVLTTDENGQSLL
jgi:uncharacterized protein (DUF2461 family)